MIVISAPSGACVWSIWAEWTRSSTSVLTRASQIPRSTAERGGGAHFRDGNRAAHRVAFDRGAVEAVSKAGGDGGFAAAAEPADDDQAGTRRYRRSRHWGSGLGPGHVEEVLDELCHQLLRELWRRCKSWRE